VSKVAVVTGGASGIGLGVVQQFAADGHQVAVLDLHGKAADAAAADVVAQGGTAVGVEVDVADRVSVADGGSYITGQVIGVNGGMYL
jgi:NAD(P)-dependent dehydrogenase (short-subunit alcohol dehydrogenase family)